MALVATILAITKSWSENFQFWKGKIISSSVGDKGVVVIQVPRKAFVKGIYLDVQTPYTAASTGSLTVGYEATDKVADAGYFMDNTAAAPLVAGMKTSTKAMYFAKGGVITVTFAKGDSAAHVAARVFADVAQVY